MNFPLSICLIIASLTTTLLAEEPSVPKPSPSLEPLYAKLKPLVSKHYPKAKITLKDNKIHFEFNTRKYMIHGRRFTGGYTEAREKIGPQSPSRDHRLHKQGGVIGDISIIAGPYGGQAAVPQVLHRHYFDCLIMAPHSVKLDHHLKVNLLFATDIPPEFDKQFKLLMNQFDKHVTRSSRAPTKSN